MKRERKRSPVLQKILDKLNEEKMKKNEMFEECLKNADPKVKEEVDRAVDLKNLIHDETQKGNIVFQTIEGLERASLEDFCKQPAEGILYDLNRDKATCMAFIPNTTWINNYACALVIEYLKNKLDEYERRENN